MSVLVIAALAAGAALGLLLVAAGLMAAAGFVAIAWRRGQPASASSSGSR